MISSYPEFGNDPLVGIAFNRIEIDPQSGDANLDVIHKKVTYEPSGGIVKCATDYRMDK